MRQFLPIVTLISICLSLVNAFHTPAHSKCNSQSQLHATPQHQQNRRETLRKFGQMFGVVASVGMLQTDASLAADKEPIVWKSGKTPVIPGQKPKDKNDTSGTRKDGNFLRAISNCKSQCENTNGPDGFARSKEECLSDCQDICCTTYEQCTFAIVPRI